MENQEIFEQELVERVYVYENGTSKEKKPVGIVKVIANIAEDIYSEYDPDEDGYVLIGITRLKDGRYVEINLCLLDYFTRGTIISEDDALLRILEYGKEELLEDKKFQELKVKYEKLVKEMED